VGRILITDLLTAIETCFYTSPSLIFAYLQARTALKFSSPRRVLPTHAFRSSVLDGAPCCSGSRIRARSGRRRTLQRYWRRSARERTVDRPCLSTESRDSRRWRSEWPYLWAAIPATLIEKGGRHAKQW
jgi:hypothetical protein